MVRGSVAVHPYTQRAYQTNPPQYQRHNLAWVGPAALAVFVYAGQLKANPLLAWFPMDLTLTSSAIGIIAFMISRWKNGPGVWGIVLPILLWVVFFLGVYQASWDEYTESKLRTLYTFTLFAAVAPFHLLRMPNQRRAFLSSLAVISVVAAVLTLADPSAGEGVIALDGTNTIGTARIAGTGALIFFILAVVLKGRMRRVLCIGAAVTLFAVLVAVGSRGPFLGIMVGVMGVLVLSPVLKRKRFPAILWSVVLAMTAFWWATQQTFYGTDRAFAWLSGERDRSTAVRESLWGSSWQSIAWEPSGIGWGDFGNLTEVASTLLRYPHNLFLEVFYEAGWIAGAALLTFLVTSMLLMCRRSHEPVGAVLFALLLFSVVNAMVSGDINDNRLMWLLLSCAWVLPAQEKQQSTLDRPDSRTRKPRKLRLPEHYQKLQTKQPSTANPPEPRPGCIQVLSLRRSVQLANSTRPMGRVS